jgi:hypothetical protein
VRRNDNNDTPIPPDLPAAANPPTGAVIDYFLPAPVSGEIAVTFYDAGGRVIRRITNAAPPPASDPAPNVPDYWLAGPLVLTNRPGVNRVVWDLRYAPPPALTHDFPISATVGDTPETPLGPLAAPGKYEVGLEIGGAVYRQPLTIVSDPRVRVPRAEFERQQSFELSGGEGMRASFAGHREATAVAEAAAERLKAIGSKPEGRKAVEALGELADRVRALRESGRAAGTAGGGRRTRPSFASLNGNWGALLEASDLADGAPTAAMREAYGDYCRDLTSLLTDWAALITNDLAGLNARLSTLHVESIAAPSAIPDSGCRAKQ